jgi:uncharacterized membrane protein
MGLTAFGRMAAAVAVLVGSLVAAVPARAESVQAEYQTWLSYWAAANGATRCLGVSGGQMTNGTRIVLYDCDGTANQLWSEVPRNNGHFYEIHNGANPHKCLAVSGGSLDRGVNLVIWDCVSSADQRWSVSTFPNGRGNVLENLKSGMFVSLLHASIANGTRVVQWPAPPYNDDQFWG